MTDRPKTLGEMTPKEAVQIMEAWRTGKKLQYWSGRWHKKHPCEALFLDGAYRLPPAEPTVHPNLWEIVPPWCNYITQDSDGIESNIVWFFDKKPTSSNGVWNLSGEVNVDGVELSPTALSWPEGIPWQDRIIMRPGYEEGE